VRKKTWREERESEWCGVVWEVRERREERGRSLFLQLRIACFVLTRLPLATRLLCVVSHAPAMPLATPNK